MAMATMTAIEPSEPIINLPLLLLQPHDLTSFWYRC